MVQKILIDKNKSKEGSRQVYWPTHANKKCDIFLTLDGWLLWCVVDAAADGLPGQDHKKHIKNEHRQT